MPLRFKCPNQECQKPLVVKDQLAGKRLACPACKKPLTVPAPVAQPATAADVEDLAADALSDKPKGTNGHAEAPQEAPKTIDFDCDWCGDPVKMPLDMAGKQSPCPHCKRLLRVPAPKVEQRETWRDAAKNIAPSAAKVNQMEAVEGVQDSKAVGVSTEALKEAGVIAAPPKPPVGVGGWIRRVAIASTAVGLALGVYLVLSRARVEKRQQDSFEDVRKDLASNEKLKTMPVLKAEAERLIAVVELSKRDGAGSGKRALESLQASRGAVSLLPASRTQDPAESLDADLFLIDLAQTILAIGLQEGDDPRDRDRIEWNEVDKELSRTIDRIQAREAKAVALRRLSCALTKMKKAEIAAGLCARFANQENAKAPLIAQLVAAGKQDLANNIAKMPNPAKETVSPLARLGYAEALARLGKTSEAAEMIQANGSAASQLESAVAVLDVLTFEGKSAAEIKPILDEASKHFKETRNRTVWPALIWIRAAAFSGDVNGAQEMVKSLPLGVRPRATLEILRVKMARSEQPTPFADLDGALPDVPAGKGLDLQATSRIQGIVSLARRNAQLGSPFDTNSLGQDDQAYKSLIQLAVSVGQIERGTPIVK